jgi:hypothetical protein
LASSHDFFITGGTEFGKTLVARALEGQGFSLSATPAGGFLATRGSAAATVLLGGLAGKKFHITFVVDFMTDQDGRLVARLNRGLGSGALKGGALGASKTNTAFQDAADAIGRSLAEAQVLAGDVAN